MTPAARKLLTTWLARCEVDHDGNALASSIVREMVRSALETLDDAVDEIVKQRAALDAAERRAAEAEGVLADYGAALREYWDCRKRAERCIDAIGEVARGNRAYHAAKERLDAHLLASVATGDR